MHKQVRKPVHILQILMALGIVLTIGIFNATDIVHAQINNKVIITLFWGDGCPHCAAEKPFLGELAQKYPGLEVRAYEIWYVEENRIPFKKMAKAFNFEVSGVPTTFIGDKYWSGFGDDIARQMEEAVKTCSLNGCKDSAEGILSEAELQQAKPLPDMDISKTSSESTIAQETIDESSDTITLPLIGTVNLDNQSLPIATLLIAFVDGVNPCSIWALTMLLALTLHTGSRKKVLIIGLVFITVTAAVYALFILGLFSVLSILSFTGWIQAIVALVALFFALVNIKDYFWYKEGLSFTIADDKKPGLFQKMRKVMDAGDSFWGLVGATIVLAAGVSLVEFSCTAGFPVIWVNLLTAQNVAPLTFGLLLLLYMFIYQIDEFGIFLVAVITLKSTRIEEKHGRILKLGGGMLMLALALTMLINPRIMNSVSSSLFVFGGAILATLLVLLVHRRILPAYGVQFGTEFNPTKKPRQKTKPRN
jgi:thiol-disulfide isomerase/thioredoxin